ncbi:MAG: class GN sortase [Gammaproteobacteria bacterium]|nr:class GN sortase [Gammaproteobacteria bacterium]NNF61989.1 class GN sortase [Gammaproteobacteria bacterium]
MALAIAGMAQLAAAAYIPAKAALAQELLERAWRDTGRSRETVKPWPWADIWPVARLQSFKHDVDLIVLSGMSGATMAFGPGHMNASALPGNEGNSIIGAHRDTHFEFLQKLTIGDRLLVERNDGSEHWFRVAYIEVADSTAGQLPLNLGGSWMTLVTCYPFGAVNPGGPLRYVVTAEKLPRARSVSHHAP